MNNSDTAEILAKLEQLQRTVDALLARKPERDDGSAFCESFTATLDNAWYTASDLLDEARPLHRRDLLAALRSLCRTGSFNPSPRQLGIALKRLSQVPPLWFRIEGEDRRGTTVWTVRDLRE